jgi:hypothetical protein
MSRIAKAATIQLAAPALPQPLGLGARVRRHLAGLDAAHARQARFAGLNGTESRDTGMSPQDLLCQTAYDPALPFFLQAGFGRD